MSAEHFCQLHFVTWTTGHDEECPVCRLSRQLAGVMADRDEWRVSGLKVMELQAENAKLRECMREADDSGKPTECRTEASIAPFGSGRRGSASERRKCSHEWELFEGENYCPKCGDFAD